MSISVVEMNADVKPDTIYEVFPLKSFLVQTLHGWQEVEQNADLFSPTENWAHYGLALLMWLPR